MNILKLLTAVLLLGSLNSYAAVEINAPMMFKDTQDRVFDSNMNQTFIYKKIECAEKLTNLVRDYFAGKTVEVVSYGKVVTLIQDSLQFCGVDDVNQGSYNLTRNVTLCVDVTDETKRVTTGAVYVTTRGNMFCDDEELKTIEGIWIH